MKINWLIWTFVCGTAGAWNRDGRDLCESEPDGLEIVPFLPLPSPVSDYPRDRRRRQGTN